MTSLIGRYVPVLLIVLFAGFGALFIGKGVLQNFFGAGDTVQPAPTPRRIGTPRPRFTPTPRPAPPTPTPDTGGVREIGSRLGVFVDEWLIDRMRGVSLRLHRPVAREVVLSLD